MSEPKKGDRPSGPTDEELSASMPRDKAAREVRVGIFVVAGVLAVIASLFLLTDPASLRGRYMLVTAVPDAGGVRRGDPVLMKGVNIGRVRAFEMTPNNLVTITMEVEGQWEIPNDSHTVLAGAGLLGGQTLEIIRGTSPVPAEENDTLPGLGENVGIMESAQGVAERADDVLGRLQEALDHGTVSAVQSSAADLQRTMSDLRALAAAQRAQVATLTATLNRTAAGFEPAGPRAAQMMARADSAALTLNRTSVTLDRAATSLDAVLTRINSGEGTLGRLSRDDSLYVSLTRAASEIGLLAADIRANPRKYVNLEIF
jgi:phospholipid/cholesterol/gamma-HCH transport system substrate-binding protein